MGLYTKNDIDNFLGFATLTFEESSQGRQEYAQHLYKWLDLVESCRLLGSGVVLAEKEYQKLISVVLSEKEGNKALTTLQDIKEATLQCVDIIKNHQELTIFGSALLPKMQFDDNSNIVFTFSFANPNENLPDVKTFTRILFINMVSYYRLEPERFEVCTKCGKNFYQHLRKNQKFCSKSCSDKGRRGKMHLE